MTLEHLRRGAWLLLSVVPAVFAHAPPPPSDLDQRVGLDQHIGAPVPMTLQFREASGERVSLRQVGDGRPLLLALGYYRCENLCSAVLRATAHSVGALSLRPGRDYEVAFVSIDARESARDAADSRRMIARLAPAAQVADWHLLSGDAASIQALAQAIGYRYFYDARNDQFAHPVGVVVLAADGRVTQYLFGVEYPPRTLRLALIGASAGRLGDVVDQLVLLCSSYDPTTGRYSLLIGRVMQIVGVAFVLLLTAALLRLRRRRLELH